MLRIVNIELIFEMCLELGQWIHIGPTWLCHYHWTETICTLSWIFFSTNLKTNTIASKKRLVHERCNYHKVITNHKYRKRYLNIKIFYYGRIIIKYPHFFKKLHRNCILEVRILLPKAINWMVWRFLFFGNGSMVYITKYFYQHCNEMFMLKFVNYFFQIMSFAYKNKK